MYIYASATFMYYIDETSLYGIKIYKYGKYVLKCNFSILIKENQLH